MLRPMLHLTQYRWIDQRAYPNIRGIYRLLCFPMERSYVGSSKNIAARWERHKAQLVAGVHPNKRLQLAYRYYGPKAFVFEVLEPVPGATLFDLFLIEQRWMDRCPLTFNVRPAGSDQFLKWKRQRNKEWKEQARSDDFHKRRYTK